MRISIIQKIVAPFFLSLIFTTASAGEWEIFTGTLIEYDQNVATRNTVEFKMVLNLTGAIEFSKSQTFKIKLALETFPNIRIPQWLIWHVS